jgi:hypothetical protein
MEAATHSFTLSSRRGSKIGAEDRWQGGRRQPLIPKVHKHCAHCTPTMFVVKGSCSPAAVLSVKVLYT